MTEPQHDDGRTVALTHITPEVPIAHGLLAYLREGDETLHAIRPAVADPTVAAWMSQLANNVWQGQAATVNAIATLERELMDLRARRDS